MMLTFAYSPVEARRERARWRTLRITRVHVRTARQCSNRHPINPGDEIVQRVGFSDGEFGVYEECAQCAAAGHSLYWNRYA